MGKGGAQQRHHATAKKRTHIWALVFLLLHVFLVFLFTFLHVLSCSFLFWLRWLLSSRLLLMTCPLCFSFLAEVFALSGSDTDDLPLFSFSILHSSSLRILLADLMLSILMSSSVSVANTCFFSPLIPKCFTSLLYFPRLLYSNCALIEKVSCDHLECLLLPLLVLFYVILISCCNYLLYVQEGLLDD